MSWRADARPELVKTFGEYTLTPERNSAGETAHLVDLGDIRIRVLPDGSHSGQMRAQVVRHACEQAAALNGVSGAVIEDLVIGHLARHDLSWEYVGYGLDVADPVAEWVGAWLASHGLSHVGAETFLSDAAHAGYRMVSER